MQATFLFLKPDLTNPCPPPNPIPEDPS